MRRPPPITDAEFEVIEPGRTPSPSDDFAGEYEAWSSWARLTFWVVLAVMTALGLGLGHLVHDASARTLDRLIG